MLALILISLLVLALSGLAVRQFVLLPRQRRERLAGPFPEAWRRIMERNAPIVVRLTLDQRARLESLVRAFVADVPFEGAGGLTIDDEKRVTIATHACLLVLENGRLFSKLRSIVVYPSVYTPIRHDDGGYLVASEHDALGESWSTGFVVLAWDASLRGGRTREDGHNVVIHEFAHQLDQEDDHTDGVPWDLSSPLYPRWRKVVDRDLDELRRRIDLGRGNAMDPYGATNEAEFFAVATETFFEKPAHLKRQFSELYGLLEDFYAFDPLATLSES